MKPVFTENTDWLSRHIPVWEKHLGHLKHRRAVALEIGCYEGRTSRWLIENILTAAGSYLYCVDPFTGPPPQTEARARWTSNLLQYVGPKVTLIECPSHEALRVEFAFDYFDLIYIDGDHRAAAVLEDAVLSWRLLKPGGILIFDDYLWANPYEPGPLMEPRIGVNAFMDVYRGKFEVLHFDYQVFLRKL